MPHLSFKGASNFTISGGNFNDVDGNVITYNFTNGSESLPPDALAALTASNTQNRLPRRQRRSLASEEQMRSLPGAHMQSLPAPVAMTSPSVPAMSVASPAATPHYSHSPRSTSTIQPASPSAFAPSPVSEFSLDLGSEGYSTASPRSSRHSSPPTDIEEHRGLGNSGVPASNHASAVDVLTPLTDSLGLQRFTPAQGPQTLPTLHEDPTPVRAPTQVLSPIAESPAPFGLELRRASSGPPPPPPDSTRPVSIVQLQQMHYERPNPLGPPPPVPPRPGVLSPAWTSTTAPVDTPFPPSRPMSVALTTPALAPRPVPTSGPQDLASPAPSTGQPELEDPSMRFARLQARRSSTKGYASGLTPSSQDATSRHPSSSGTAPSSPPPLPSTSRSNSSPGAPVINPLPITPVPPVANPQARHWTSNSISDWAGGVNGRRCDFSDTQSSGDSRSVQPPTTPSHPQMDLYDEQRYQHQLPPPPHHFNHQPLHLQPFTHGRLQSHNAPWEVSQPHPHQTLGYNQAPPQPPFSGFPPNNAPAFIVPPFGAPGPFGPSFGGPAFGGPAFGGPAFGGGYPP